MNNSDKPYYTSALYMDLEWTCWDSPQPRSRKQEIIEIGIVELDLISLKITRETAYLVRPNHLDISLRCMQITGIERSDLKEAPRFPAVFEQLIHDFNPRVKLCCVWGNDTEVFAAECRLQQLHSPFRNVLDISEFFCNAHLLRQRPSLQSALELLALPFDGVAHTALADARNTARVHAELLCRIRRSVDDAPPSIATDVSQPGPTLFGEKLARSLGPRK